MAGSPTERLLARFAEFGDRTAVWSTDGAATYSKLLAEVARWRDMLVAAGVAAGRAVLVASDELTPETAAATFALAQLGAIVIPVRPAEHGAEAVRGKVSGACCVIRPADASISRLDGEGHPLYGELSQRSAPGLVLFSSGTTGEPKATLHDLARLLDKFHKPFSAASALAFMPWDHIGGVDVILYTLSGGGELVVSGDRSPEAIARLIEVRSVALLPASPTFLNLLLLSGAAERHDLSCLQTIAYGAEPMPQATLDRLHAALPSVRLVQTYGMSELGTVRTESRDDASLWVRFKGAGVEHRVVDGMLQVKAPTAMVGYLNAPSPFTDDGWLMTGDEVEVDGEYYRVRGRRSEIINVGGEKVYPSEVEDVLVAMDDVADARVYGEPHPLLGSIVCAEVAANSNDVDPKSLSRAIKRRCREVLASYKVPVKIRIVDELEVGARYKKQRTDGAGERGE